MTTDLDARGAEHLLRADGQEEVCLALYRPSTGSRRTTALLAGLVLPLPGERTVHGTASFQGSYVVRAASLAAANDLGVALLHSHPGGIGWQGMSRVDRDTERSYAHVAEIITGQPLIGMTLAGDRTWSARTWDPDRGHRDAESVRVVGPGFRIHWNNVVRPAPVVTNSQVRTVSAWGEAIQRDLARLRILVVGAGTVGLDLAIRLAQAGVQNVAVMDFDTVEEVNLDRLVTATRLDARLFRGKVYVARRALRAATTTAIPEIESFDLSVCEPDGEQLALDYDIIFSCVDRPWPRAVLNQLAYSDLIPVIDGGLAITPFADHGMRNATWRTHVISPGRPCLMCNGQIDGAQVARDRAGLFDDDAYIKRAGLDAPARENVSLLAPSVTASMLSQFVSLVVAPGGLSAPSPLRYSLATHTLEHLQVESRAGCMYEPMTGAGDMRAKLTKAHAAAEASRLARAANARRPFVRLGRSAQNILQRASAALQQTSP
ncbi:ThiF family adenylyltransferase [Amycolatopsis sp. H20-H5]|uniref:ThiF family adenylyltransferase n=1 Tax=Amycolatopsis sp. H20-H5 TaxID=3046309 RepID=UPI002DB8318B|nr:ThiF family adenylyltransferase [Amycolatopsis sp. H20-H5]MEC3978717.1 ThiF family adenylyltransferase [Amycolatopsis sp. H20-H5]